MFNGFFVVIDDLNAQFDHLAAIGRYNRGQFSVSSNRIDNVVRFIEVCSDQKLLLTNNKFSHRVVKSAHLASVFFSQLWAQIVNTPIGHRWHESMDSIILVQHCALWSFFDPSLSFILSGLWLRENEKNMGPAQLILVAS